MASTVIMSLIEKYAEGDVLNNIPREELIQAIRELGGNTKTQKPKKAKKVRDPDAPKRGRNAYWCSAENSGNQGIRLQRKGCC